MSIRVNDQSTAANVSHASFDDAVIDRKVLPQFAFPGDITTDLPHRTSHKAKLLLARAIGLCRPGRDGYVLGGQELHELRDLVGACHILSDSRDEERPEGAVLGEQERAFDSFFGLSRGRSPDALAIGIVWGIVATLEEISYPNALVPAETAALMDAFRRLAKLFVPNSSWQTVPAGSDTLMISRHPMERWRNGHTIFVAITSGLIFHHLRAIAAIENEDFGDCRMALNDLCGLFFASAAALRLTGDMPAEDYEEVRSIMAPPRVPEGFSGLFNCDHRHLLRLTKQLGMLLKNERSEISWERENYWSALNAAYSSHIAVCTKLVGRMASIATVSKGQEIPAHEKLEGFAKRALHLGGYPIRSVGRAPV
ncbi:hypothetical protein [Rhizobium bangladeshense]|nr:hypothetical protein [Rhizobium bangladeshense]MBX4899747.1 hypothetical protein [Rhizobium bangladeshense]MBY3617918.1 hypothetical protein [Rhizobium bangladeshense]